MNALTGMVGVGGTLNPMLLLARYSSSCLHVKFLGASM